MNDEINIEELEKLALDATPGTWIVGTCAYPENYVESINLDVMICVIEPRGYGPFYSTKKQRKNNAAYIASANPATVLSLIARLKSAEAERDALAAKLAELEGQEPVGIVIHTDVRPGKDGMYRHDVLSEMRLSDQTELYVRPVPAVEMLPEQRKPTTPRAVRLTPREIAKALAEASLKPEDYREDGQIEPLCLAIETAALRKNGMEPDHAPIP